MKRKLSILLAFGALIASTLACAFGEPTLSNVRTAKDQDGKEQTSVFAPSDTVYVVSDLANGVTGNEVSSKWYLVSADGYDPQVLDEGNIVLDQDKLAYTVYFYFRLPMAPGLQVPTKLKYLSTEPWLAQLNLQFSKKIKKEDGHPVG
ncbi:MAG: hypothetical protein U0Z26_08430 [Anaerolineales bacterium]